MPLPFSPEGLHRTYTVAQIRHAAEQYGGFGRLGEDFAWDALCWWTCQTATA